MQPLKPTKIVSLYEFPCNNSYSCHRGFVWTKGVVLMITNGKEAGPWHNLSVKSSWSEVWDVISWHQNRNTQVIEERTNRRPPDRKKYDTLMWGPTGRREDLDNVTKEREREGQRKELQIYMHNIMSKTRDKGAALSFYLCTKDIPLSLITSMILKTYLCTHLFAYICTAMLYQSDSNPMAKTAIDGKMLLYRQCIAVSKWVLLYLPINLCSLLTPLLTSFY